MKDFFDSLGKLYTEQRELAAIWLEKPVITPNGRTVRIAPGQLVRIENGVLIDSEKATHKVVLCLGTMISKFQIVAIHLETNLPETINL